MSEADPKHTLKIAILEWRSKYIVQGGDPMLAAVELWEIYFTHTQLKELKKPMLTCKKQWATQKTTHKILACLKSLRLGLN
jgi:hypothetical protein